MGSQDSNFNSGGFPVDHDGVPLEFGGGGSEDETISMLRLRREVEDSPTPMGTNEVCGGDALVIGVHSSSGGIPMEVAATFDEEPVFEDDRDRMERDSVNRAAKFAFGVNREERNELICLKQKMIELQHYLVQNGLSMAAFEKQSMADKASFNVGFDNSVNFISGRDEYGLAIFTKHKTEEAGRVAPKVFDRNSDRDNSGVKNLEGAGTSGEFFF